VYDSLHKTPHAKVERYIEKKYLSGSAQTNPEDTPNPVVRDIPSESLSFTAHSVVADQRVFRLQAYRSG
jgi:hypothetical protein